MGFGKAWILERYKLEICDIVCVLSVQNLARQKSVDAFSADAWHLRAYSPKCQQLPAFTGPFDAATDPHGPCHPLLQLSTGCAEASNAEQVSATFRKDTNAHICAALDIPIVISFS